MNNSPFHDYRVNFVPYEIGKPTTIMPSEFDGSEVLEGKRQILPIILTVSEGTDGYWNYQTQIGPITSGIRIPVKPGEPIGNEGMDVKTISVTGIVAGLNPELETNSYISTAVDFYVQFWDPPIDLIPSCLYKTQDRYRFINDTGTLRMSVVFERIGILDESVRCDSRSALNSILNRSISVPSITIISQSLIDGSDLGDSIFTIIDDFQYYHHKTTPIIPDHNCKILRSNNPKTTTFSRTCLLIVSILRGIGETAWDKINYLFDNGKADVNDIYNFALNIFEYAMLRYILARLMYGNFNINYVLNKYNKKFLKDLSNTRFCNFIQRFTNPNSNIFEYNKYFL